MKVVPMIFNTDMVKALMAGDKVVTRRPVSPYPEASGFGYDWWPSKKFSSMVQVSGFEKIDCDYKRDFVEETVRDACPIANIGDLIYVRETWGVVSHQFDDHGNMVKWTPDRPSTQVKELKFGKGYYTGHAIYRADGEMRWCNDFEDEVSAWKPSIHMPRTASRLTLKVTDVRIEKLQDITEEQCWKEGIEHTIGTFDIYQLSEMAKTFDGTFEDAKASFACLWDSIYKDWHQNPYVWVIEFEVIHQNVDQYLQSIKNAA
ncbi:hypothetical protein [Vibrio cholerae]|uniref:hypothetical protein n=1 Tax=Vibrio cholerae TaxID=666 RepID=UPI000E09EA02|nr:hypothetical protein [Vibrio cholerae]